MCVCLCVVVVVVSVGVMCEGATVSRASPPPYQMGLSEQTAPSRVRRGAVRGPALEGGRARAAPLTDRISLDRNLLARAPLGSYPACSPAPQPYSSDAPGERVRRDEMEEGGGRRVEVGVDQQWQEDIRVEDV